ncbi:MAG: GerMN domain-containing protein [Actinomycetota bacterium]
MSKKLLLVVLAVATAACAKGTTAGPAAGPGNTLPATPASSTPTASPGTTRVTIYYLASGTSRAYLAPERHTIARTPAIAKAALAELVHGTAQDPDHTTPFPSTATINAVTISNKVATVDWSAEVLTASAGAETEKLGIQSIVYTLTEFPTITKVRFTVEGKASGTASNGRAIEDFWGHEGLIGQPWDRDPQIDVLAPITLWTPLDGSRSDGTLKLTGEASTFEANVGIILRNAAGKVVKQTSTTASIGAPDRGTYSAMITFAPPAGAQTWTLEVSEDSAKDGSVVFRETRSIRVG